MTNQPLPPHEAIFLLTADHRQIDALFEEYESLAKSADRAGKAKAALRICHALTVHATIEQEIFYPAAAQVLDGSSREVVAHAIVEHGHIKRLIAKLESMNVDDPEFDSSVHFLAGHVRHHVKEAEARMFPELQRSKLDLVGTGERMAARKAELSTRPLDTEVIRHSRTVMGR
jgi:hypothetical protein